MTPSPESLPTRYSTKVIKAGALLADTRTLFTYWDPSASTRDNLSRMQSENLFGKTSRSRVDDILAIFRQRYLKEPSTARALATLVQNNVAAGVLDPIFYFYAARADALLSDVVTDLLAPRQSVGRPDITTDDVQSFITERVRERGEGEDSWSEPTTRRVAQGVLATLRDFGVLRGVAKKQVTAIYLLTEAFAFIAFVLLHETRAANVVLQHPDWRLFFLHPDVVERLLFEAHQQHLLHYQVAGRVVRIDFPTSGIEEYARALTQRTY